MDLCYNVYEDLCKISLRHSVRLETTSFRVKDHVGSFV